MISVQALASVSRCRLCNRSELHILHTCNQRTYLLTQLKRQGLSQTQLQSVFDAIILARILYASPAWRGCLNAVDRNSLQQLFVKARRWQIVSDNYDVSQLFVNCDIALFKSSLNVNHCLRHLYPDNRRHVHSMTLRPRGHNFTLPKCRLQNTRNSFINMILFACVYNVQFVVFLKVLYVYTVNQSD